jgi:23S rRNA-/tRNA-specific pseudouridylate synthase
LRSGVVHRLDVDTSGVLLFALSEKRWQELRDAFSDHVVQKRYLALVHGVVQAPGDVELELVVARRSPSFVRVARDSDRDRAGCRNCRTVYRPVAQLVDSSLVELMPESGYLHQIRVTMAHIGHPLVGDHRYGHEDGVDRHMLHAAELKVGEISVAAPLALDFEKELRLRGWD